MKVKCEFVYRDGKHVCRNCGRVVEAPADSPIAAYCRKQPELPPITTRAIHYASALANHIISGCRTRPDDEVNIILQICQACPYHNKIGSFCTKCGCRCNANRSALTNKIRMKSQSCPVNRW